MMVVLSCQAGLRVHAEVLAGKLGTVADAQKRAFGKESDVCTVL